ncbi:MAG: C4-dicarboxylate ABC transporter permease, partial [Alphaproteobacteria bacterium]|nr:C4-dicarboxylate ABC transporter permease [Alphaproteobacteria bacterium]
MTGENWFPDIKGRGRTLSGYFAVIYSLTAAGFSLWYLYTSGFGLVSTETNRGFYLLFTSILVFLIFPAWRGAPAHRPSIIDIVFIGAAIACIGYWM